MAFSQAPVPESPGKHLPPVTIEGHALFDFSMRMGRALRRLEHRFGSSSQGSVPQQRKHWQPVVPRKPR